MTTGPDVETIPLNLQALHHSASDRLLPATLHARDPRSLIESDVSLLTHIEWRIRRAH